MRYKSKVYSIINLKGGIGKTTSALAIGEILADKGYKILFIDMDMQRDLTIGAGCGEDDNELNVLDFIKGNQAAIIEADNYDVVNGASDFIEQKITSVNALDKIISRVKPSYDVVIIDCPPALNKITMSALIASDSVIIPVQADKYNLDAIERINGYIEGVNAEYQKDIQIKGVIVNCYDKRSIFQSQFADMIQDKAKKELKTKLFKTRVRRSIGIAEAANIGAYMPDYCKRVKAYEDFKAVVEELIKAKI